MSRRAPLVGVVLLTLMTMSVVPVRAGIADRIGATFALMANDFIGAFKPVEGTVVAVDRHLIYVDVGDAAGARVGQELSVFRKGEAFRHPITGKLLGYFEEALGWVQIRHVQPEFSEAIFIAADDKPAPRPEDGVRISRGRIKVAITPTLDLADSSGDLRRVPYLLASVLERSKRFQVTDPLAVADMFAGSGVRVEEVLARPERSTRAAKNLDVAGWLVPMLLERGGIIYLDVTWISAATGTALFSRRAPLLPAGASEEQRFPWEPRPED